MTEDLEYLDPSWAVRLGRAMRRIRRHAGDAMLVESSRKLVDEFDRRVERRVTLDERRADYLLKLRAAAEELFHELREADEKLDLAEQGAEQVFHDQLHKLAFGTAVMAQIKLAVELAIAAFVGVSLSLSYGVVRRNAVGVEEPTTLTVFAAVALALAGFTITIVTRVWLLRRKNLRMVSVRELAHCQAHMSYHHGRARAFRECEQDVGNAWLALTGNALSDATLAQFLELFLEEKESAARWAEKRKPLVEKTGTKAEDRLTEASQGDLADFADFLN
jgi:hypothetical protein